MSYQIGTDEAGYGPNLGPMTITGTLWNVENIHLDLYHPLASAVTANCTDVNAKKILIADSKIVHSGKHGLRKLERSVLAIATSKLGYVPANCHDLVNLLGPPSVADALLEQPWLVARNLPLPVVADVSEIQFLADHFVTVCDAAQIRLQAIHCTPIFPNQFNQELEVFGNKATLLTTRTLKIVRELLDQSNADVFIGCDKHGGRSKYAAFIQEYLTANFVTVGNQSLAVSDYQFRDSDRDVKIQFLAKGESHLPTAVSSMVAKYLREIMMLLWNDYWQQHVPGIKPTKGYPLDAKRFKREITDAQQKLGISDEIVWRRS